MRWIYPALIGASLFLFGCGSAPQTISVPLQDVDSPLAVVIFAAERTSDRLLAAEVFVRGARGYADAGALNDSGVAADAAVQILETLPPSPETLSAFLQVAAVYSDIQRPESAASILERSLSFSLEFTEADRASAYVRIVATALAGTDDTRSIVRATVDQVYVIEDTLLRAQTLAYIAEAYQLSGVGLSVIGLIQQAIPAVRSAEDPTQRALLFARLAVLSHKSGETTTSASLIASTLEELDSITSFEPGAAEIPIADTAVYLAAAGQREEALARISGLSDLGVTIDAEIRVAATEADLDLRRSALVGAADRADRLEPPSAYVEIVIRLASEYLVIGDLGAASEYVEQAANLVTDDPSFLDDADLVNEIVFFQSALDHFAAASDLISMVDDPYIRGELYLTVAAQLVKQRRGGEADDYLLEALDAAEETAYLADDLRERVASGFSVNRSYGLAVRTIQRIEDPTLRLRAAADLGYHAVVLGGMRDTTREELRLSLGLR